MAFQELMRKNNLLGGRYSAPPSCPLPSTSSPSPPPTSADPTPRNLKSPSPKRKRPNVVTSTVVHSNNRIQTTTGFMVMEARNAELYENFEPNDIGPVLQSTKQRKTADRLKDPIVDKTQKRKPKTNLNAFKAQFLTLKKKISAITITPANFRPRKVFTPGYFNHFENEDESEKERGNHSNIDEELQNIEGRESSMEDKAEEQIEEPSCSDNEM